jgi:peptidoglycan/LPS O-acetylase OafA/YrhL
VTSRSKTTTALAAAAIAVAAVLVDLVVGASVPGRTLLVVALATAALVLVPKEVSRRWLARPVGSRPGEVGPASEEWGR